MLKYLITDKNYRMEVQVLYEDNHLIAVNKPAGWLVHGDETEDFTLLDYVKEFIKIRYQKPGNVFCNVIHRLDRPVSGVVVMARTSKVLPRMNKLFQERKIQKTYWAITAQQPEPLVGHLTHFIAKDKSKNVSRAYDFMSHRAERAKAKKSELDYNMKAKISDHHLLEVNPLTGRPHQIRVQLAAMGCPIRGDVKYGYPKANKDKNIHLHCRSLTFIHPVKNESVKIVAEPPNDPIWNLFEGVTQLIRVVQNRPGVNPN